MNPTTIAVAILAVAAVATIIVLIANAASKRKLTEDIPPAMRPAYSDDALEGRVLERYMSWGLVLTLFFAIFLPAYWLREPGRIQARAENRFVIEYARGEELYQANCSSCHGSDARGGATVSPYGDEAWPAPNLRTIAQRYADSRTVSDMRDHILTTLERGRPGTPMPAWGAAFGGPMTDAQLEAITDWLLANQEDEVAEATSAASVSGEDLYEQNCVRCHGADLQGIVGPSLIGVFERHSEETILGILRNGINLTGSGMFMPPWQNGYMYPDSRYTDDALGRIVDYLRERQPETVPDDARQYQTPGVGDPAGDDADSTEV